MKRNYVCIRLHIVQTNSTHFLCIVRRSIVFVLYILRRKCTYGICFGSTFNILSTKVDVYIEGMSIIVPSITYIVFAITE